MNKRSNRSGHFGDDAPLSSGTRRDAPDKREVSLRWLFGSALTGVTSIALMGTALFVALDGKQFLATPPEVASLDDYIKRNSGDSSSKTGRLLLTGKIEKPKATDRRRMSISTMTQVGDASVVRTMPFEQLQIALAADNKAPVSYPDFDPMRIFADGDVSTLASASTGSILYGANVETEASIKTVNFSSLAGFADDTYVLSDEEAEAIVRQTAAILTDGTIEVASLSYVDPSRFGGEDPSLLTIGTFPSAARIIPQNISVAPMDPSGELGIGFEETVITAKRNEPIDTVLAKTDADGIEGMATAIKTLLNTQQFSDRHTVKVGLQARDGVKSIVRTTIYDGDEHVTTIALNDRGQYVPAPEPDDGLAINAPDDALQPEIALLAERDLPTAYDAIYRGILSYGLDKTMAAQIVRMVAADVDFRSRIKFGDRLELFYSLPEDAGAGAERGLLYVGATFGGQTRKFYRFTDSEGVSDYFDAEGRSARQFLLRNPVPTGQFRSGYGMRRHPILKYSKMHWGVDWSAPRGTPIIAPGNGVVAKAGWSSGYGKQTVITHANGYETSYSHQTAFAKDIAPGTRVRQGQVIGYVGTTGLSTGPHLHYEMRVNGERVDPMRVRLPQGKTLSGADLANFKRERDRIDDLLSEQTDKEQVASILN